MRAKRGDVQQDPIGIQSGGNGQAGGAQADGEAMRRDDRDSLFVLARIRVEGTDEVVSVRVRNVSSGGLMAQASEALRPGVRVDIELDGVGRVTGAVAWSEAGRIGIAFDHPVDKQRARKSKAGPSSSGLELVRPVADCRRPPLISR